MKYFKNCKTIEEAKLLYKKLAKEFHPDMKGGSKEVFQEMESEYRNFLATSIKEKQKDFFDKTEFVNYLKDFFKDNPELMQVVIKSIIESDSIKKFIKKNSDIIDTGISIYNLLKQNQ